MGGFDITGVVFGGSSLTISGLEHWRDVAGVVRHLIDPHKEFQKCLADAEFYALKYEDNLKNLLRPIASPEDVVSLVKDPCGPDWNDDGLQVLLKRQLGDSFQLYSRTMQQINGATLELKKELSLDKPAIQNRLALLPPPAQTGSSTVGVWDWVLSEAEYKAFLTKFSCSQSTRDNLIGELEKCNGRLKELLERSNGASTSPKVPQPTPDHTLNLEVQSERSRSKSHHLYNALKCSWGCQCEQLHFAHLRLEHRTTSAICFNVILSFSDPPTNTEDTWTWKELDCYGVQDPNPKDVKLRSREASSSCHGQPSVTPIGAPSSCCATPHIELQTLDRPRLCQRLEGGDSAVSNTTISHGDETYSLEPRDARIPTNVADMVTLKDALCHNSVLPLFNPRQRVHLALLVASSVAQLRLTDWLLGGITKEDIFFIPRNYGEEAVPYTEPFIRRGFGRPMPSPKHKDKWFLTLGILLLELCYGQCFEDHELYRESYAALGETKERFQRMIALQRAKKVKDDAGAGWARAINWCLNSAYDIERTWRSEIIKNVIRPLEESHEYFEGANTC